MIYLATIDRIGPCVASGLDENMLITFLHNGPADCLEYAIALSPSFIDTRNAIAPGDNLRIGEQEWHISATGEEAMQSLSELGHLTLIFDGATTSRHRGAVHLVEEKPSLDTLAGDFAILEISR